MCIRTRKRPSNRAQMYDANEANEIAWEASNLPDPDATDKDEDDK